MYPLDTYPRRATLAPAMSYDIPAGSPSVASPAATLTPKAIADAAKRYSVATTKTYYGFNCRPRQVKSVACKRDADRVADAVERGTLDPAIASAYAERLAAAVAKARAAHDATRRDYDAMESRCHAAHAADVLRALRAARQSLWRRHDAADERLTDLTQALAAVRGGLERKRLADAEKGGAL